MTPLQHDYSQRRFIPGKASPRVAWRRSFWPAVVAPSATCAAACFFFVRMLRWVEGRHWEHSIEVGIPFGLITWLTLHIHYIQYTCVLQCVQVYISTAMKIARISQLSQVPWGHEERGSGGVWWPSWGKLALSWGDLLWRVFYVVLLHRKWSFYI